MSSTTLLPRWTRRLFTLGSREYVPLVGLISWVRDILLFWVCMGASVGQLVGDVQMRKPEAWAESHSPMRATVPPWLVTCARLGNEVAVYLPWLSAMQSVPLLPRSPSQFGSISPLHSPFAQPLQSPAQQQPWPRTSGRCSRLMRFSPSCLSQISR